MMHGFVLDTGVLIGLERCKSSVAGLVDQTLQRGARVVVPHPRISEFCQGKEATTSRVLRLLKKQGVRFEPLTLEECKIAGRARAHVMKRRSRHEGPSLIDAMVMAMAAARGYVVMTSDMDDMMALQSYFQAVRLIGL